MKKPVIRTYYPQSVFLPDGIERAVSLEEQELIGALLPIEQQAYYDSKTLFYDLFVQFNRLICIGPPFYNIGKPLAIKHKGKDLSFKLKRGHRWRGPEVIDIKIPSKESQKAQLDLEFVFKEFAIEVSCNCHKNISLTRRDLCLIAMQKDNPLIWLKDWCRWHIRVHGVERIVLYDNGSNYWSSLDRELSEIDEEVEIILVHWPCKHGPTTAILSEYGYAHTGMFNHFRFFFGIQTTWLINLDIDEFLYFDSPLSLREYLQLSENLIRPYILLAHYLFPPGQAPVKKRVRFYHHRTRYKVSKYWNATNAPKYICQPNMVELILTHVCELTKLQEIRLLLMRIKEAAISKNWDMVFKLLLSRTERLQWQKVDGKGKLFFCHFRDLYTGWRKGDHGKREVIGPLEKVQPLSSLNPAFLVEDRRVIDKAIETGMVTELEVPQDS